MAIQKIEFATGRVLTDAEAEALGNNAWWLLVTCDQCLGSTLSIHGFNDEPSIVMMLLSSGWHTIRGGSRRICENCFDQRVFNLFHWPPAAPAATVTTDPFFGFDPKDSPLPPLDDFAELSVAPAPETFWYPTQADQDKHNERVQAALDKLSSAQRRLLAENGTQLHLLPSDPEGLAS